MTLLEIKGLTKAFEPDKTAVSQVSLSIAEGEIVCLLGPSGCGKTTLLRMIAGLEIPDAGEVWFDSQDIRPVPPHQRDFGMMFQDFALFPHKNVAANVAFGLQMRGDNKASVTARVTEMLELVALRGYEARDIAQLSGGEQQRVALARALAPGPRLLMLDEPLGALDRALRERLMLDLRAILKQVGVTAVYVTHDQTEAFAIADRIAVMNAGQIEQLAAPEIIYNQPSTPFVARFLGFRNLLAAAVITPQIVDTPIGRLHCSSCHLEIGITGTVLIKPNAVKLQQTSNDCPNDNKLMGVITAISFRGKYYQVWLNVREQLLMFELANKQRWPVGAELILSLDPNGLLFFPS